eukprot:6459069-Amphidinium_carterae.1
MDCTEASPGASPRVRASFSIKLGFCACTVTAFQDGATSVESLLSLMQLKHSSWSQSCYPCPWDKSSTRYESSEVTLFQSYQCFCSLGLVFGVLSEADSHLQGRQIHRGRRAPLVYGDRHPSEMQGLLHWPQCVGSTIGSVRSASPYEPEVKPETPSGTCRGIVTLLQERVEGLPVIWCDRLQALRLDAPHPLGTREGVSFEHPFVFVSGFFNPQYGQDAQVLKEDLNKSCAHSTELNSDPAKPKFVSPQQNVAPDRHDPDVVSSTSPIIDEKLEDLNMGLSPDALSSDHVLEDSSDQACNVHTESPVLSLSVQQDPLPPCRDRRHCHSSKLS